MAYQSKKKRADEESGMYSLETADEYVLMEESPAGASSVS